MEFKFSEDVNFRAAFHMLEFLRLHGVLEEMRPEEWHTFSVDIRVDNTGEGDMVVYIDSLELIAHGRVEEGVDAPATGG